MVRSQAAEPFPSVRLASCHLTTDLVPDLAATISRGVCTRALMAWPALGLSMVSGGRVACHDHGPLHVRRGSACFFTAVKFTLSDLRLKLAFVPLIGGLFMPDEDKTHNDEDGA